MYKSFYYVMLHHMFGKLSCADDFTQNSYLQMQVNLQELLCVNVNVNMNMNVNVNGNACGMQI